MLTHKFILYSLLLFALTISSTFPVEIIGCKSGDVNWFCEVGKRCTCITEGPCTNGNLLVYQSSISTPICSPTISGSYASIDWDACSVISSYIKVRADCDESQSSEKVISISLASSQTTTTTTLASKFPCPSEYECCEDELNYINKLCKRDLKCCNHVCKESCEEPVVEGSSPMPLLLIFGLLVITGVILFLRKKVKENKPKQAWPFRSPENY